MKARFRRPWKTKRTKARGELSWALILSLLSSAATIIGVLAAYVGDIERKLMLWLLLLVLGVVAAAIVAIFVKLMIREYAEQRREMDWDAKLLESVPRQLRFTRRTDRILVHPAGSGELYWHFELVAEPEAHITKISLPVYVEVPRERESWTSINIEWVKVNGGEVNAESAFRKVERKLPELRPKEVTEHGVIAVDVPLGKGKERCEVEVKAKLNSAFLKVKEADSHTVDIPYVTDNLRVIVESVDPEYAPRTASHWDRTVEPLSQTMEILDAEEAQRQHEDYGPDRTGKMLVWEPTSTKLGYSYKLWFRLERKPAGRPGRDSAAVDRSTAASR